MLIKLKFFINKKYKNKKMNSVNDPLGISIPYVESDFTIGFLSSILHTFILIFFAELGDKTFIMLFILQLRTNKVTIFYSALFAEILMNSFACFLGFIINYLLYQNFIDYLGILFFIIYGIFLFLWGFKHEDETFENEFEIIEEMLKKKTRTSLMILGVEQDDIENEKELDKYNLDLVNNYTSKQFVPTIKKELTIIPEGDISREDSTISENPGILLSAKKEKSGGHEDNDFILGNNKNNLNLNNSAFSLKLKKPTKSNESSDSKKSINLNKNSSSEIIVQTNNNNNNEEENKNEEEDTINLRGKRKYKSRYYLDYFDKNIDTEQPNIDTKVFGTIFFTICLSEFGDRTQLISLTASSIFNFWGSLLGSCTALFCSCLLGVYFTRPVMKAFKQRVIDFILGIIFFASGIQIYIFKLKSQSTL